MTIRSKSKNRVLATYVVGKFMFPLDPSANNRISMRFLESGEEWETHVCQGTSHIVDNNLRISIQLKTDETRASGI